MTTEVWYLIFNDKKKLLFSPSKVKVNDIYDLKKAIKEEAFLYLNTVQAPYLIAWRSNEPLLSTQEDDELQEHLLKIDFLNREQVVKLASGVDLADLQLGKKEILLVQVPDMHSEKKQNSEEEESYLSKFHRERNAYIEACRRDDGIKYDGEPVGLYHPVFNEFQTALENTEPFHTDAETYISVRDFLAAFSQIYQDERERAEIIKETMRPLLGRELLVDDKVESDGVITQLIMQPCGRSTAYLLILEVSPGMDHSNFHFRGSYAYWNNWVSKDRLIDRCYCPSIILVIAGPYLCVFGGVYCENVIAQPFTDYIWLDDDSFNPQKLVSVAKLFAALKSAISSLSNYYNALELDLPSSTVSPYPYITEYGPDKIKFTYKLRLPFEQSNKLLYVATLDDMPDTQIVVKFAQRYNAEAHRLLAAEGLAPILHYSSTDDNIRYGKRFMIVMDFVDIERISDRLTENQFESIKKSVEKAIDILHSNDVVFGDLRPPNILFGNNTTMLIDFDWCGKAGKDRYPPEMNPDEDFGWHDDAGADRLMSPDHDMHMLAGLFY